MAVRKKSHTFALAFEKTPEMELKMQANAPVAQLVEHLTLNQGVQGSSPCGCTTEDQRVTEMWLSFIFALVKRK